MEPPAQHGAGGLRRRCGHRSRGFEVLGVDARERSQKARGPVHLRAASTCHRRPTYGLVDLRAASTHGLAMAPRHEEPVDGILDQAEIRTALLTRHGPLAAPP